MAAIPWGTILKNAPALLAAADALLLQAKRKTAASEMTGDLNALRRHVAELEQQQRASAEVVRQLADQVNAMVLAAQESSARLRRAYAFAIAGVILAVVSSLLAFLR